MTHESLHLALDRMVVAPKLKTTYETILQNPQSIIEMNGGTSEWKQQTSGIRRQGCPLSPYVFLMMMKVMYHDIHQDEELEKGNPIKQITWNNVNANVYADGTRI